MAFRSAASKATMVREIFMRSSWQRQDYLAAEASSKDQRPAEQHSAAGVPLRHGSGRRTSAMRSTVAAMTNSDYPVGTAARRHRDRAARRCARPPAHDLPLEGRRPRRGRAADPHRRLLADPRRPAQAPRRRGGLHVHDQADAASRSARRGTPPAGTAATTGSSPPPPTTRPNSSTRSGTVPSNGPAPGSTRPWPTADSTSSSTSPGPTVDHASLRRLVCDLIEEYGRHTGHADLLREAVDGLVGEDPPAGWQASASR